MRSFTKPIAASAGSLESKALSCSVVIATRNRPEPISNTLWSLNRQKALPGTVVIVDSSDGKETADAVARLREALRFKVVYRRTEIRSAAIQRNIGAESETSDIILFLDDDVDLEPSCLIEILSVFENDPTGQVGGVSATISNQVYSDPKGLNRFLLGICVGGWKGAYAGRLLGPAVNFLPIDTPDTVQITDWLPSTCTAYRREVFLKYRFAEFEGYSFAEDVDLSSRIAKDYQLLNTTGARVFHHDLGKNTHKDWRSLGKSMVVNRHGIMVNTMGRHGLLDNLRLLWYEIFYSSLAWLAAGANGRRLRTLAQLICGKISGFLFVWTGGHQRAPVSPKP
jgi:GT2 family glycosyltransferase